MPPSCDISPTILLADDEGALAELFSTWLRRAGYTVLSAADGEEALSLFLQFRSSINLVIADVRMPFLSGVELAAVAKLYGCPALLISGSDLPSRASGLDWEFLLKPFPCEAFLRSTAKLLARGRRDSAPRQRVLVA